MIDRVIWAAFIFGGWLLAQTLWLFTTGIWVASLGEPFAVFAALGIAVFTCPNKHQTNKAANQ